MKCVPGTLFFEPNAHTTSRNPSFRRKRRQPRFFFCFFIASTARVSRRSARRVRGEPSVGARDRGGIGSLSPRQRRRVAVGALPASSNCIPISSSPKVPSTPSLLWAKQPTKSSMRRCREAAASRRRPPSACTAGGISRRVLARGAATQPVLGHPRPFEIG